MLKLHGCEKIGRNAQLRILKINTNKNAKRQNMDSVFSPIVYRFRLLALLELTLIL